MKERKAENDLSGSRDRKSPGQNANNKGTDMSIKKIKEMVDLMNNNNLAEMEVEQEGLKIRLIKTRCGTVEQVNYMPSAQFQAPPTADNYSAQQDAPKKSGKEVPSPMVGTFYKSPSPEDAAYVSVGDVVKAGDVLCIVEAMKLMNEVKAEFGGRITEILVENAESVEFGQALFLVESA